MGWKDLFSNMAEWDPRDLEAGGILGASMAAKARKQAEEMAGRPKPGSFCNKGCAINDGRCTPCLALQKECGSLFSQVEKLEEMEALTSEQVQQLTQSKTITECSLCGAPYEKGQRECPYCGTAYPEGAIDFDVPLSKQERHDQLMSKAAEAWDAYLKVNTLQMQYLKEAPQPGLIGVLQKFAAGASGMVQGMMKQNASEIQEAAKHYGVSISQYLYGASRGEYQTLKSIRLEEMNKRNNEQAAQRNALFQQQQAQRAASQPSGGSLMDFRARQMQYSGTPNYVGGSGGGTGGGVCCGNCANYMTSGKCAADHGRNGYVTANDSGMGCRDWARK